MNTLILSCTTGEGHNACARAIKEYYDIMEKPCVIKDALAFVSEEVSRLVAKGHILIYRKFSSVFGWGYEYCQNHPESFDEDSGLYHFFARGTEALYGYIAENGFDTIICTHPFAALMVTDLRRRCGLQADTALVSTDYTCCPGVNCSDLDTYFIPDPLLVEEFTESGIPENKIVPSGIPIRQDFYGGWDSGAAKKAFGIPAQCRHIVMASGSMGCGPMEELAQMVAPQLGDHIHLSIVCGTNEKLLESMQELYRGNSHVHVLGFVENMPMLLDSADVYVTKPGGLSITEAMSKGSFMVLVNAVGGCESYNLAHLLKLKKAVTADTVEDLADACVKAAAGNLPPADTSHVGNSAKIIYETMEKRNLRNESEKMESTCS